MAVIELETDRLDTLYEHAITITVCKDEIAYCAEIAEDIDERIFHNYVRKAYLQGRIV